MALDELLAILSKQPARPMRIPALWNTFGFDAKGEGGEFVADGVAFFCEAIRHIQAHPSPLSEGDLRETAIYSVLPRFFTAWDHGSGLEGGTFLKALCLLPHITKLRAGIVYLLPVFEPSGMYKKGNLGSPYAIKDFFNLDKALHDPLLGAFDPKLLSLEFEAFVEACHLLGMKVMLDFVFRTCARDNVLVKEHPDWFYWIDASSAGTFAPPYVPSLPGNTLISAKTAKALYNAPGTKEYVGRFAEDPRARNPALFEACGGSLGEIETKLGVTTAPAFSDVLNDRQPYWSDVTYLRMDLGKNAHAKRFPEAPPFVLHDTIKLDLFAADIPNNALWALLENIVPHYIERYDIDGARIDMGHALPKALLRRMVEKMRAAKPGFILWSEVFDVRRAQGARNEGFDFITGDIWNSCAPLLTGKDKPKLVRGVARSALPPVAAPEMPDTPRAARVYADETLWKSVVLFCALMPNAIPMWNAGIELGEKQPMNLGLGSDKAGRFALDETDPNYGKLAFFDACALHWDADVPSRAEHIAACMALRSEMLSFLLGGKVMPRAAMSVLSVSVEREGQKLRAWFNRTDKSLLVRSGEGVMKYQNGQFTGGACKAGMLTLKPRGAAVIIEQER